MENYNFNLDIDNNPHFYIISNNNIKFKCFKFIINKFNVLIDNYEEYNKEKPIEEYTINLNFNDKEINNFIYYIYSRNIIGNIIDERLIFLKNVLNIYNYLEYNTIIDDSTIFSEITPKYLIDNYVKWYNLFLKSKEKILDYSSLHIQYPINIFIYYKNFILKSDKYTYDYTDFFNYIEYALNYEKNNLYMEYDKLIENELNKYSQI